MAPTLCHKDGKTLWSADVLFALCQNGLRFQAVKQLAEMTKARNKAEYRVVHLMRNLDEADKKLASKA